MQSGKTRHATRKQKPQSIQQHDLLSQFDEPAYASDDHYAFDNDSAPQDSDPEPEVERVGASGLLAADSVPTVYQPRLQLADSDDHDRHEDVASRPLQPADPVQADDWGHVRSPVLARFILDSCFGSACVSITHPLALPDLSTSMPPFSPQGCYGRILSVGCPLHRFDGFDVFPNSHSYLGFGAVANPRASIPFRATVRNYVPSSISIAIPSAAPTPPRVSRPVSFGKFMSPSASDPQARRQSWGSGADFGVPPVLDDAFGLGDPEDDDRGAQGGFPREISRGAPRHRAHRVGQVGQFAPCRWLWQVAAVVTGRVPLRTADLGLLQPRVSAGHPESAADGMGQDGFCGCLAHSDGIDGVRSLFFVTTFGWDNRDPDFIVYSLSTHSVIKTFSVPGLVSFSSNADFIIITTANPSTLRILSSSTFATLSIISSTSLTPFTHHSSNTNANDTNNSVLLPTSIDAEDAAPRSVFALSHRLLAFASPPPRPDSPASTQPRRCSPVRRGSVSGNGTPSLSQGELGKMALRVGGSVLSGMWSLGEVAYTAARTRIADASGTTGTHRVRQQRWAA
ncbi:hypothetical protein EVG20_g7681 [Dentipellis fragilis]|uniref:Uncharacterized protein n=1 Tax=Dentipellis fragilis TaxID=205917 RepID=A0A4Y9YB29_9AGAM|nr:hypothetical protein EVG20_g7681 [Dentipellis fragilis]